MRRNATTLLMLLLSAPALAAVDETPRPATAGPHVLQGDITHGRALYEAHCQSCHGLNGIGGAQEDAPRLSDTGRLNALQDAKLLDLMREGDSSRPKKKRHAKMPAELSLMDLWDIVGFLRSRTVEGSTLFPAADRFSASTATPDAYALERLNKTTGKSFTAEESRFPVLVAHKTGWGGHTVLLPNDPRVLANLKLNMKVGYVVAVPLLGQERATEVVFALDPKTMAIVDARALLMDGTPQPELDKKLTRFVGKGDRRLSGQPKATLKVTGGGKDFAALEGPVTEAFVRGAEAVTAYEIVERDAHFGDDDF